MTELNARRLVWGHLNVLKASRLLNIIDDRFWHLALTLTLNLKTLYTKTIHDHLAKLS